jgi:hypothetical protein
MTIRLGFSFPLRFSFAAWKSSEVRSFLSSEQNMNSGYSVLDGSSLTLLFSRQIFNIVSH